MPYPILFQLYAGNTQTIKTRVSRQLLCVPEVGLEPTIREEAGFESAAYTSSATPAINIILLALYEPCNARDRIPP